ADDETRRLAAPHGADGLPETAESATASLESRRPARDRCLRGRRDPDRRARIATVALPQAAVVQDAHAGPPPPPLSGTRPRPPAHARRTRAPQPVCVAARPIRRDSGHLVPLQRHTTWPPVRTPARSTPVRQRRSRTARRASRLRTRGNGRKGLRGRRRGGSAAPSPVLDAAAEAYPATLTPR